MGLRFFDLFAGIGGFRLGFEREGYKCVGFCEIDAKARRLYKAFFNTTGEMEIEDATKIFPEQLPDFDILTAGMPCQPFSMSGKRKGLKDDRGYPLWQAMFRLIKVKKPKIIFLENVKGLLSSNRGWDFAYLLYKMDELGYDAEWTTLNSKAFGVPQNRERLFIIGYSRGQCRGQIFPIRESDKVYYEAPKHRKKVYKNNSEEVALCMLARQYVSWKGTYVAEKHSEYRIRKLTPLECFRLQGFPDEIYYKAKEIGISDNQIYKFTGNAVGVPIIQTIARKIKKNVVFK